MKKVVLITAMSTLFSVMAYILLEYLKSTNRVRRSFPGGIGYASVVNRHM